MALTIIYVDALLYLLFQYRCPVVLLNISVNNSQPCKTDLPKTAVPATNDTRDGLIFRGWKNSLSRGLTGGFLLLQNFSVAISVSPHVCFILVLILMSMFLR